MELKRVSFKVAKALKEAGYPQPEIDSPETDIWGYIKHPSNCYFTGSHSYYDDYRESRLEWDETDELHTIADWANEIEPRFYGSAIAAPTYIDTWLWLWREKNVRFDVEDLWDAELSYPERGCASNTNQLGGICTPEVSDPEEAIIAAIEYLADNNLIK